MCVCVWQWEIKREIKKDSERERERKRKERASEGERERDGLREKRGVGLPELEDHRSRFEQRHIAAKERFIHTKEPCTHS